MIECKDVCFFLKDRERNLFRFSYDRNMGICYKVLKAGKWSNKRSVYKNSFEYFYVLEDEEGIINLFCQDISGDIVLCRLEGEEWTYKILLYMKNEVITPIKIKAFMYKNDINLIYNISDQSSNSEILIYQIVNLEIGYSYPQIVFEEDYKTYLYSYKEENIILSSIREEDQYEIVLKKFNNKERNFEKEEVIDKSQRPYIDFALLINKNKNHYLFVDEKEKTNRVIYKCKEEALEERKILFEKEDIKSCLLIEFNKEIWALWICDNKLYGSFSKSNGEDFTSPKIYKEFYNMVPKKVPYQGEIKSGEDNINYIYSLDLEGEELFFLINILKNPIEIDVKYEIKEEIINNKEKSILKEEITHEELSSLMEEDYKGNEVLEKEKIELEEKIIKLNSVIEEFYKKVEKLHFNIRELNKEKVQAEEEIERLKIIISKLHLKVEDLNLKIHKSEEHIKNINSKIEDYKSVIKVKDESIKQNEINIREKDELIKKYEKEIEVLELKTNLLKEEVGNLNGIIKEYKISFENKDERVKEYKNIIKFKDDIIEKKEEYIKLKEKEVEDIKNKNKDYVVEIKKLGEVEDLYQDKINNLNRSIEELMKKIKDNNKYYEDRTAKFEDSNKNNEVLNMKIKYLEAKIRVLNVDNKDLREEVLILKETISHQKSKINNLQHKFYNEKEDNRICKKENEELKEENKSLEERLIKITEEKLLIEKRLKQKEEENKLLREKKKAIKINDLYDLERNEIDIDNDKDSKFSLIKWLFDSEG